MFDANLYPPEWRAMRQAKLEQVGYRCESCGIAHLALRENSRSGAPYVVYLSIAHKKQYETWKHDADTMALCQRCHRRYDRQFRRKAGHRLPCSRALNEPACRLSTHCPAARTKGTRPCFIVSNSAALCDHAHDWHDTRLVRLPGCAFHHWPLRHP